MNKVLSTYLVWVGRAGVALAFLTIAPHIPLLNGPIVAYAEHGVVAAVLEIIHLSIGVGLGAAAMEWLERRQEKSQ